MDDRMIVDLYWDRSENAISETQIKYGKLLYSISLSLLSSKEDAEECVNDTYLAAWNSMPDERPEHLCAFLCKIDRRISINRYNHLHRQKRGGPDMIIEELTECIPSDNDVQGGYDSKRLAEALDRFLGELDTEKRVAFVKRYFYSKSLDEISHQMHISKAKLKSMLFRMRDQLYHILESEELL